MGKKYLSVALIRSSAKSLFFKAVLCHLAYDDMVGGKRAIQTYAIEDPSFDGSREQKFLSDLVDAINNGSVKDFN